MSIKTMKLRPGDKVRVIENFIMWEMDPGVLYMTASKGSIATVLSYDELSDYLYRVYANDHWRLGTLPSWLAWKKKLMEEGTHYAIRFDKVVRPSEEEMAHWAEEAEGVSAVFSVDCRTGGVEVLTTEYLEKVNDYRLEVESFEGRMEFD